jgi:hyperosmotically inducible protein
MKVMRVLIVLLLAALGAGQITGCAATATEDKSAGTTVDDTVINTRVKTALLEDPQVKGTEVQVETFKGVVQLSGFVDSAAIADRAVEIAEKVPGVVSVKNDMRLKPQG